MFKDSWLDKNKPTIYWNMMQTAENVAKRYNMPKERMDHFGAESQQRFAPRDAGKSSTTKSCRSR